jgi:hypothetical protein
MRILSWRLIVGLIIGVSLVSLASSWYEVQAQKDSLRSDLNHKAETLGESLAGTAELYLSSQDRAGLEQLVEHFSNREHLVGIGIYGRDESALVVTPGLNALLPDLTQLLKNARQSQHKHLHPSAIQALPCAGSTTARRR